MGNALNRSFCIKNFSPDSKILQLETRSLLSSSGCDGSELESKSIVRISPIGRCLEKMKRSKTTIILIALLWVTQPWYPMLLEMLVEHPILLNSNIETLTHLSGEIHPLLQNRTLKLTAWKVSGEKKYLETYRERLKTLSSNPGQLIPFMRCRRNYELFN